MILDTLDRASLYAGVSPRLALAFQSLAGDLVSRPNGRYELEGENVYAIVQSYTTRAPEGGIWEAHRRYIDVQFVVSGVERMGYLPIERATVSQPYDEQSDAALFTDPAGAGSFVTVPAGSFALFFPHDVHSPTLALGTPSPVKKVVVKVAL